MAFGATVGDTPLVKAYVGTTPAKRIYVGDKHVWPPFSSRVTYVGSQVFAGTASTSFPTHTPNDLLVIFAMGGAAPVAPAGWTDVPTGQSGNPAGTLAYRWATSTGASTGVWTGNGTGVMYVFRGVDQINPFGTVSTTLGSTAGTVVTAPAITLTDPSGGSMVAHNYYHDGTSGSWVNKAPANFIVKNLTARMASTLAIDTASADVEESSLTHSQSAKWRSLSFEIKAPEVSTGLYAVDVEYLPAYEVRFTCRTTYAESANDGFSFTSTPTAGQNGYTARVFTKKWSSQTAQTCTIQDIYGGGAGGTLNTITVTVSPKP